MWLLQGRGVVWRHDILGGQMGVAFSEEPGCVSVAFSEEGVV